MSAAAPAEVPAPGLFVGLVMHHRLRPFRHRFVYRVFSLLLDVDQVDGRTGGTRLLSIERANLFSFRAQDHGARNGAPLRPWVEARLAEAGLGFAPGPIRLLCFPRLLGYVFNPISIYYCYDAERALRAVVHEVKNTLGDQQAYALPVTRPEAGAPIRQRCAKAFYVSPFIDLEAGYRFKLRPPEDRLSVIIQEEIAEGTQLIATLTGDRRPLTDRELLRAAIRIPFMPQKVIAGIHWEALKLWLKGARFRPRHGIGPSVKPAPVGGEKA